MISSVAIQKFISDDDTALQDLPAVKGDLCYVIDESAIYVKVDDLNWEQLSSNKYFE